jgi:hypothetical protein
MPLYATKCPVCQKKEDIFLTLARYNDLPQCCGVTVERIITAPHVVADIQPYKSMITGEMITSRSQHRSHLKQHGMVEVGDEKIPEQPKALPDVGGLKEELYARVSG